MKRLLILLLVGFIGIYYFFGFSSCADESGDGGALTYLIVGFDDVAENTDVMLLLNYRPEDNTAAVVQIPRDTYAAFNTSQNKINQIYSGARYGGKGAAEAMSILTEAISDTLGISIDGYAGFTTDALVRLVDNFGGVDIELPHSLEIPDGEGNKISLKAGKNHLTGNEARGFIRYRSGYSLGDLSRIDAQKLFLSAFIKRVRTGMSVRTALNCISDSGEGMVTNLKTRDILKMLMKKSGRLSELKTIYATLPGASVQSESGLWYYSVSRSAADELLALSGFHRTHAFDPEARLCRAGDASFTKIYNDTSVKPRIYDDTLSGLEIK